MEQQLTQLQNERTEISDAERDENATVKQLARKVILDQEIEDLREAGKRDRAEQLELKAKELIEELEKHDPHKSKRKSGALESSRLFEQRMKERRKAVAHLEALSEELEPFKGEKPEAARNRLEERAEKS